MSAVKKNIRRLDYTENKLKITNLWVVYGYVLDSSFLR